MSKKQQPIKFSIIKLSINIKINMQTYISKQFNQKNQKQSAFFLFINTVSGSNIGKKYLSIQAQKICFRFKSMVHVFFFNLNNNQQRCRGIQLVKKHQQEYNVHIIICGGDGTVLWIIQQLLNGSVNLDLVTFAIIPNGTGNDFSRTLGWGTKPTQFSQNKLSELKKLIHTWLKAKKQKYDIWDFQLQLYQDGEFRRVQNKQQKVMETKIMKKSFSNYFGIGIDARIGYSFQKRRSKSRFMNLACYACIGLFKWCKGIKKIDQFIQNMETQQELTYNILKENQTIQNSQKGLNKKQLIFHTCKEDYGNINHLKKGFKSILCMNSTSFMGAADGVWDSKKAAIHQNNEEQTHYTSQKFSDGKIEFVSFESEFQLGLERYLSGRGSRLAQGSGPFSINFRKLQEDTDTFLQIDGQFFKVKNPKYLRIERTKKIVGSQINVLVKQP